MLNPSPEESKKGSTSIISASLLQTITSQANSHFFDNIFRAIIHTKTDIKDHKMKITEMKIIQDNPYFSHIHEGNLYLYLN
jgi:hypothetical protein